MKEATYSHNYPDIGTGVAGDDDRPPGNIVYGEKYKKIDFYNRLTPFNKNQVPDDGNWKWDEFEMSKGMEDNDNYSETLSALDGRIPKETLRNVWKRMKNPSAKQVAKYFDTKGQPWRTTDTQLGTDKEVTADDIVERINTIII